MRCTIHYPRERKRGTMHLMDVKQEFPRETEFESIFLTWQFICHPPVPAGSLADTSQVFLIKQERINNRCLKEGEVDSPPSPENHTQLLVRTGQGKQ